MDVTNAAPSATFMLDPQSTPVALHRFLQAQPGGGHVTIEFKLPRDTGGQKIPVMRVVHRGEREVFTDDSRQALMRKLGEWNDALVDQPGGPDAARMLNGLVGTGKELSLDVQELAPAIAAMSDAHHAAHPSAYVKAWRENEQQVMDIVVSKEKGRAAEKIDEDQRALRFALKVLSRFEDVDSMEIDGRVIQEQAWNLSQNLSPDDHRLLLIALMLLSRHTASVEGIIGPEVVLLLRLCWQAQGRTLTEFKSDMATKQTVMQLMAAMKKTSVTRSELQDSPYARTVSARTGATSQPLVANNGTNKAGKTHQRRGSMPALYLTKQPKFTGSMASETENPVNNPPKTTAPKSPRSRASPASIGSQTVKGNTKNERPKLRRNRTDAEDAQPGGAAATSPSSSAPVMPWQPSVVPPSTSNTSEKTEKSKRRLERSGTASQTRRDTDDDALQPLGRDSHDRNSSAKSSGSGKASKSGKSSKTSSGESSPEDKDKSAKSLPRKTRRERSGDSDLVSQQAAVSTTSVLTTSGTKPRKGEGSERVPKSRRAPRTSQPEPLELKELFASEKFRKAREELEQLPSYQPVRAPAYTPK